MTEVFIDYQKLAEVCQINGLKSNRNPQTSEDAHEQFMQEYSSIFAKRSRVKQVPAFMRRQEPVPKLSLVSAHANCDTDKATGGTGSSDADTTGLPQKKYGPEFSHDIRDYMARVHKHRVAEDEFSMKSERIKNLRKILKKLPFERSSEENESLFQSLKKFPEINSQMEDHILREMCMAVQMDVWKESDITVFGNLSFYMVLRGSVRPVSKYYMRTVNDKDARVSSPTPEDEEEMKDFRLRPGDCFGTLVKVADRNVNSRILSVVTAETNCELLKITTSDYARITEQIESRDRTEKINLLQSTGNYKFWTRQPLQKVAKLFSWITFPVNTILVTEGSKAKFIAFIKTGECHVLRQVTAIHKLKNGKTEKRRKQVVMGKLGPSESFGEDSVLGDVTMSFSIITATECVVAIIDPDRLKELDDTTRQLLHQSSSNSFANLKESDIHDEFIEQELKREWNEFKHGVVMEVLNDRAVRPGLGKWSK